MGFPKFRHGARKLYQVVLDRGRFFGKTFFAPKIREMDKNSLKIWFFEFKQKFDH